MTRASPRAMLGAVRTPALLAAAVAALSWSAVPAVSRAQFDRDFPPSDGPGKTRTPEPPEAHEDDAHGDAPRDVPRFALGAGAHFGFGIAPALATGVQVSAEIATYRWSLGIEGRYDLPARGDTSPDARARTWLAGASFVPCARAKALWACGVVLLSHVTSSGTSDDGASARDSWFVLGVGARMALHFAIGRAFALRVVGEALVHPIPWVLASGGQTIYKSSVVSTTIGPALVHAF